MIDQFPGTLPLGIQWPDINPIRIVMLLIEVAFVVFGIHLSFKFFKNYRTLHDTVRGSRMHAAWGWLFFSYAIMRAFLIIADFYMMEPVTRETYMTFGYVSAATGALFYISNIERVGFIKTHYVFTIIFLVFYAILIVLLIFFISFHQFFDLLRNFSTMFWFPIIVLFLIYALKVHKQVQGRLKIYTILMILGIILIIIAYFGTTDIGIRYLGGLPMRLSSDIGSIVGIFVVTLFFSMLPSWREIEWHAALESLFIIYRGGICIYQHSFRKQSDISNNQTVVVGNVIEIIKSLLQKGTSGRLKAIDFNEKKILLEQGENVIVVMNAEVETESLNFLLHKFLILFERFFHDILEDWQGDNVEFEPTNALIQEIFG